VRQNAAHIVGFKVVEMRSGTVQLDRDVVSGAMREEILKARCRILLPNAKRAANRLAGRPPE